MERALALFRLQQREDDAARSTLLQLHRRAAEEAILGAEVFCAFDQSVVLRSGEGGCAEQNALSLHPSDPPNLWAWKVRALAALGDAYDARRALMLVSPERLRSLPCDREYLGTPGALARVAVQLSAAEHARVIYELLAPYPEYFAVNSAFHCEGSVSHLLGLLARSLGEPSRARGHFKTALGVRARTGLNAFAVEAQREFAAEVSLAAIGFGG